MSKISKFIFTTSLFCLLFLSCNHYADDTNIISSNSEPYIPGVDFTSFSLTGNGDTLYVPFSITDGVINICVPNQADLTNLVPVFTHNTKEVYRNGVLQESGVNKIDFSDFAHPVKYTLVSSEGNSKEWTIIIYNLPVLTIDTPDEVPILSKDTRVKNCQVKLITYDEKTSLGTAGIKVRGNSTALQEKKPYNVKFDEKQAILGMNKSKKWVLLSNPYYDRTQLHNAVAFEVARLTDYDWVQSGKFVELILNDQHKGLYYLCEKIDIEKNKINIKELDSTDIDPEKITGGYLLEADILYEDEPYSFKTDYFNTTGADFYYSYGWVLTNPDEDVPQVQMDYIKSAMNTMESRIFGTSEVLEDDYLYYFDIESAINWWMIEEVCANEESSRTKNLMMYKDRGDDKFYIAPPWDFDAWSFGFAGTETLFAKPTALYYHRLFQSPTFVNRVKEKWAGVKDIWLETIPDYIDSLYTEINKSAKRNEVMWPDWISVNDYPNTSYETLCGNMKNAFIQQVNYVDSIIQGL